MKKKYMAVTALTLTLAGGLLAGCGSGKDIGQEAAKEAAFTDAQVAEGDTARLKVSKDRDDGKQIYEVEFTAGNREYSYEISASDGEILSAETEELQGSAQKNTGTQSQDNSGTQASQSQDNQNLQSGQTQDNQTTQGSQTQDNQTVQNSQAQSNQTAQNSQNQQNSSSQNVSVSEADAKAAALERVPGAADTDIKIELDFDDGQYIYEGDIIYDGKEYEFEIDANTGNFLKWSEEKW